VYFTQEERLFEFNKMKRLRGKKEKRRKEGPFVSQFFNSRHIVLTFPFGRSWDSLKIQQRITSKVKIHNQKSRCPQKASLTPAILH
jgi:hypothetical protein